MAHPLQVIAHYYVRDGKADQVASALQALAEATRTEPGNRSYAFVQSCENPLHFVILERYSTERGLEEHRATGHFQTIATDIIAPLLQRKEVETFIVSDDGG